MTSTVEKYEQATGRRHVPPRDDAGAADWEASGKTWERKQRAQAAKNDRELRDAYRDGQRQAREEARAKRRSSTKSRSSSTKSRRRRPARKVARQLQQPVRAQLAGGMRTLGLSLGVVALYLFLTNAGAVSGFVGGLARGLEWLSRPDRSIPYRN